MKNVLKYCFVALSMTMLTGVSGCGGASNTVEMPTNPVPPPISGPVGVNSEDGDALPGIEAPAAPEP